MSEHSKLMKKAIDLSKKSIEELGGGPFGAIVVKEGEIVGRGTNCVTKNNDPTAHAEVMAIRDACQNMKTFQLEDCIIYSSCEPCPMCLSAIYWARPKALYFAASKEDAAKIDFDDAFIYEEVSKKAGDRKLKSKQILQKKAIEVFEIWDRKRDKIEY